MHKSLTIFFIFFTFSKIFSQLNGEIYYLKDSTKTIINFGPCYIYDEVYEQFLLKNTGVGELRMLNVSPSLEIYASPDALTEFEYLRFSPHSPVLPFNLNNSDRSSEILVIKYTPLPDLLAEPLGKKEALMKIGLVNPKDTSKVIVQKNFKLIAKKTLKFVDGFEDLINFDSVFINSNFENKKQYSIRNTQNFPISIIKSTDSLITQPYATPEFSFEQKIYPIEILPKKSSITYDISYKPIDIGCDTSIFKIHFIPKPNEKPDSTDFCYVKVVGCGVFQKLTLSNANANFYKDTIYIGDIPANKQTILNLKLKNDGNIPYGISSQYIWDNLTNSVTNIATILIPFPQTNLRPQSEVEISISIKPNRRGYFSYKYVIENDFPNRKLFGYTYTDTRKEIYIIGRAIAPEIFTNIDTIDFGNVVYSADIEGDCPSSKDTLIKILNIGNTKLFINDILIDDEYRFFVSKKETIIDSNSFESLKFTFNSSYPPGIYYSRARFINNSASPKDTFTIILKAASVPPIFAKLSISENHKSKPGGFINIPILLKSENYKPSIYSKFYELTLNFNPTLLKYVGKETVGTASDGIFVDIDDKSRGQISIKAQSENYLLPKDTLIILKFKSFLGDNKTTSLSFQNTVFGSGNCKRIYDLKVENGKFELDSVCGLPYKINPIGFNKEFIVSLKPNPANEFIEIEVNINDNSKVYFLKLINIFGEIVADMKLNQIEKGINSIILHPSDLPNGAYIVILSDGVNNIDSKTFLLKR